MRTRTVMPRTMRTVLVTLMSLPARMPPRTAARIRMARRIADPMRIRAAHTPWVNVPARPSRAGHSRTHLRC